MRFFTLILMAMLVTLSACETPNDIPAQGSGVVTTEDYLSPDSVCAVSPEDTPGVLGAAGKRTGEALKDANEDVGKAAENSVKFFKKL